MSILSNQIKFKEADFASLDNELFVCFDLETTGLSAIDEEIIEIGVVFFRLREGSIYNLGSFNKFVKPTKPIPPKITDITSISDEMVNQADDISKLMNSFKNYIDCLKSQNSDLNCVSFIAQNAKFDISFLTKAMLDTDIIIKYDKVYDTKVISKHIMPDEKKHNLATLCERFEVDYDADSHHRADYDAKITTLVFYNQIIYYFLNFDINRTVIQNGNGITEPQMKYLHALVAMQDLESNLKLEFINNPLNVVNSLNVSLMIEYLKKKV